MRPRALDEVVGQQHLLGERAPLRRLVESDEPMSLVLYGPPGTGKTTLAHVISLATKRQFVQLSALDSGVKEVRAVITAAKRELTYAGRRTVLFIDEVHRFSKTQQDSLLSAVEDRIVSLIAATTENPFFSVVSPLLQPQPRAGPAAAVATTTSGPCCARALTSDRGLDGAVTLTEEAQEHLVRVAGGDARKALTALESGAGAAVAAGSTELDLETLETAVAQAAVRYDRQGDQHYDVASALIKSIRGSDVDAALHYLARMVVGGGGPPVHRPAAGHLRQRGHRHGRPDGAAHRGRRRRRGRLHRHARGALPARPRRRPPGHGAEVQRRHGGAWASRWPTCTPGWPGRCRRACATPTTPGRRSSATARPTTTRTPTPTASSRSSTRPTRWSARTTTGPPTGAPRRGSVERLAKLRAIVRRGR